MSDISRQVSIRGKYSSVALLTYKLRPQKPEEKAKKPAWGEMEAEQYYEPTSTGEAIPFRHFRELLLYDGGDRVFDGIVASVKVASSYIVKSIKDYANRKNIQLNSKDYASDQLSRPFTLNIVTRVPIIYTDTVDTEIFFCIDDSPVAIADITKVLSAIGPYSMLRFSAEILEPVRIALGIPPNG